MELLEKRLVSEPTVLFMPDGSTEMLRGRGYYLLDLFVRACNGEQTPELELIAQSVSSAEPGGGQMIDLTRDVLNGRKGDTSGSEAPEVDEGDFSF